jgi:hypothetical protein
MTVRPSRLVLPRHFALDRLVADRALPGRKSPTRGGDGLGRPYKNAVQNRFPMENAGGVLLPRRGPDRRRELRRPACPAEESTGLAIVLLPAQALNKRYTIFAGVSPYKANGGARERERPAAGGVTHTAPSKYHGEIISLAFIHTKYGEPIVIMVFRRTIQKVLCLSPPPAAAAHLPAPDLRAAARPAADEASAVPLLLLAALALDLDDLTAAGQSLPLHRWVFLRNFLQARMRALRCAAAAHLPALDLLAAARAAWRQGMIILHGGSGGATIVSCWCHLPP